MTFDDSDLAGLNQPTIVVGPLLRYTDDTRATIWVESSHPCRVTVRVGDTGTADSEVDGQRHSSSTWTVHDHHFALVVVDGLLPGSLNHYNVALDDVVVWPLPDSDFPPPVIRTSSADGPHRLAFGSCRKTGPFDDPHLEELGPDALVALAWRMVESDMESWPDTLLMLGDQIYADDPSEQLVDRIVEANQDLGVLASREIQNFEQYTWLYEESWTVPEVRWLLSTVPTCMLLDDHDLRDDWNSSHSWRERVTKTDWWRDRVIGAYASYWVFQHLGNLNPDDLAADEVLSAMHGLASDEERTAYLDAFAWRVDTDPSASRFSFVRDLGGSGRGTRLVAVDSRCSRVLDPDGRRMVDEVEWEWIRDAVLSPDRPYDHLLFASTLPVLMLPGIHHLEGWNEASCQKPGNGPFKHVAEVVRQAVDLEHWAAFRESMHEVVALLTELVQLDEPPASVLMLAGDVHCSYTAPAELVRASHSDTVVHQLVMSPFRHGMPGSVKKVNRLLDRPRWASFVHRMARRAGVRDVDISWQVEHGQWFDNGVMTITLDGRAASLEVAHARLLDGHQRLVPTTDFYLGHEPPPQDPDRAASTS